MKIPIINKKCECCLKVMKDVFEKHGYFNCIVSRGEVITEVDLSSEQLNEVVCSLFIYGFETTQDVKLIIVERIKNEIRNYVYHTDGEDKMKISELIQKKLNREGRYFDNLFFEKTGIRMEQFYVNLKMERIKSLLTTELTISEIAFKLKYSSESHLTTDFKKENNGTTPSEYRELNKIIFFPPL